MEEFVDNKTSEEQLLWHEGEGELGTAAAIGSNQKWGRKAKVGAAWLKLSYYVD